MAHEMRILQVDAISYFINQSNVQGLSEAYRRVAELRTFDYRKVNEKHGHIVMNEQLVQLATEFQPDLIHLEKSELIQSNSIKKMQELTTAKIIYVFPDYLAKVPSYVTNACPYVDWVLYPHQDPKWAKQCHDAGCRKTSFWTRGVDPEIFKPHQLEKKYDLIMIAHRAGNPLPGAGQGDRHRFLLDLNDTGLEVHLFGLMNQEFAAHHEHINNHNCVDLLAFAKTVSATKIALAYNSNKTQLYCSWRRLFNTMASGCFILVHYFPGLETIFKNNHHLTWFKTTDEAIELIEYYLTHDEARNKIAGQGRQEVITYHTWDIRIERMLNLAFRDLPDKPRFARFEVDDNK